MQQSKVNNKLSTMFPNIAGYDKIREEGAQIIDIITRKQEYLKVGARCPKGWFFYGDPGMGKTQIVKDIASFVNYPIIEISSSDAIKRKYTIEEDVIKGFEQAKTLGKCIVFIDELDKFAGYKKYIYDVPENLKTQKIILHELDEIKRFDDVIVIATANYREYLDEALLRSGRFDRQVLFPRPNEDDRLAIIKHFLKEVKLSNNVSLVDLVKMTANRTCAEIECMVNEAKICLVAKGETEIGLYDFTTALNRVIFSDIPKEVSKSNNQLKMVAYHEVSHALLAYLLQPETLNYISVVPQGKSAGSVRLNGDDDIVKTKEYCESVLKIALAGMVAVKVMTGTMTCGNTSDLEKAFKLVQTMTNEGFYGIEYVTFADRGSSFEKEIKFSRGLTGLKGEKIYEILNSAIKQVEEVLSKNTVIVEKLAIILVEKQELSKSEILQIISENNFAS